MSTFNLFEFVYDNALEYHWHHELKANYPDDVILFVDIHSIGDFMKILKSGRMVEDGFECRMKNKYFCFWMAEICEYFDVDINEVFPDNITGPDNNI